MGFFTRKEVESVTRPDGKTYSCVSCGLYRDCTSPKMPPYGNFKKKILVIGEAPGEVEDRLGKPWQGKSGKLLQSTFKRLGIDLFEDCLNINSVYCRPMDKENNNRAPSNYEVECCRRTTLQIIDKNKPKVIILLGAMAVFGLLGHRWKKDLGGITKWRGWIIPDQDLKAWICPTFHPSFIERSDTGIEEVIWEQDLKQAFAKVKDPLYIYKEPTIEIIEDLSVLNKIRGEGVEIAFDYETTGIKPHAVGHRIVSCAIATSEDFAYAFMMPQTQRERQPLVDLLTDPIVKKIAQNMKYEHKWGLVRLRIETQGWVWDTMLASHIFDNRPGITNLAFQTYVQFGIVDYKSEVGEYLEDSDKTNANSQNKIMKLVAMPRGKEKLLKYNGYDAINEFRLAVKQRENILPF